MSLQSQIKKAKRGKLEMVITSSKYAPLFRDELATKDNKGQGAFRKYHCKKSLDETLAKVPIKCRTLELSFQVSLFFINP